MRAAIVIGLGYGDEGKGALVQQLVKENDAKNVVRFNGGAQAGHQVFDTLGRSHIFSQFGAGSFIPGVNTILSRFMLVEPLALFKEAEKLTEIGMNDVLRRLMVSENAPIIPRCNILLNRIMEIFRSGGRHGSCGMGIGLTQRDVETLGEKALRVKDLLSGEGLLREKLRALVALRVSEAQSFRNVDTEQLILELEGIDVNAEISLYGDFRRKVGIVSDEEIAHLLRTKNSVFEGAQGVLLDQNFGFFPHVTRSNCTFVNALELLNEAGFKGEVEKIGVLRAYSTRHGAGPFVTEDSTMNVPPCHNQLNNWQGNFRTGWFDAVAARYAIVAVGGVDSLAITNLDRLTGIERPKICVSYENADSRFFSEKSIHVLQTDYPLLTERTATMSNISPRYIELPGWEKTPSRNMERFIERIEEEVKAPIRRLSYSQSPSWTFRNGYQNSWARVA